MKAVYYVIYCTLLLPFPFIWYSVNVLLIHHNQLPRIMEMKLDTIHQRRVLLLVSRMTEDFFYFFTRSFLFRECSHAWTTVLCSKSTGKFFFV